MTPAEQAVAEALGARPQTIEDLCRSTGLDRRSIEAAVQGLRLLGTPVCSGPDGVWTAQTAAELARTERALRGRVLSQLRTYSAVKRARRRMEEREAGYGELTLFPWRVVA